MEITVRDDERDPELRVRWYEGTSTFHIEVAEGSVDEYGMPELWQEVAVQTHYGDDDGNPPSYKAGAWHAYVMLNDGSARELADAEIDAR